MSKDDPTDAHAFAKRTQRAHEALADGLWRIELEPAGDNRWTVQNGSGKSYTVIDKDGVWTCSCPDRPPAGVPCKHIIGIQLVLEKWTARDEMTIQQAVRSFTHGGYGMTHISTDTFKTLTGLTLSELAELLDRELPAAAYKPVPARGITLTDIDPNWMRKVLNDAFGVCGLGWGYDYDPADIEHFMVDRDASAVVKRLEFWYVLVGKDRDLRRCEVPATGASENNSPQYALKGAITNAIGHAVSNLGFQLSIYLGQRSHKTVKSKPSANGDKPKKKPAAKKPAKKTTRKATTKKPSPNSQQADDPADYVIPAGKHQGERLGDVGEEVLAWYVNKLKPTTPETEELKTQATALLERRQVTVKE